MALSGRSIAVLAYPGYQELEFWYPLLRAREEGATVRVVSSSTGECESYLGYPVIGDQAPADVDIAGLDALIVPGTAVGRPPASDEQLQLIKSAHAADRRIYASGTGVELVTHLLGDLPESRCVADADGLPALLRQVQAELAG